MECRLCQNETLNLFYEQGHKNQFKYYKCQACGLVNIDLKNLDITHHQEKYVDGFKAVTNHEADKGAKAAFQFIKRYAPKGSYLDIGCGSGSVLYFAKKDGWQVKGLELSQELAKHIERTLNIDVHVTNFLTLHDFEEQFDVVSLRHVLEHLPDSLLALDKISALLKPGGYAYFEFPNINSLSHRTQRFLSRYNIHKKSYPPSYQPGHCNEFSKQSFSYLLKLTNFELIRWETYSYKPIKNFLYNHLHIGTKARALVRKKNNGCC